MNRVIPSQSAQSLLLREALGSVLRAYRLEEHRTLRDVAESARVSSGYLSELERGCKEVSSEVLRSICDALHLSVSTVLMRAAMSMESSSGSQLRAA